MSAMRRRCQGSHVLNTVVEFSSPAHHTFVGSRGRMAIIEGIRFATGTGTNVRDKEANPEVELFQVVPGCDWHGEREGMSPNP